MAFSAKLAELFVAIKADDAPLNRDFASIRGKLAAQVRDFARMSRIPFSIVGAVAGAVITRELLGAVQAASDLGETINKVDEVFGRSASKVKGFADEMADKFGLVRNETLALVADIGLVLQAGGMLESQSADLSVSLAKLAADAASFYNLPVEVVLEKMKSGLVGQAEPMRSLGVLLSEAAVAEKALAMGLARSASELDNNAKVMARAALITEGLAKASGDLERTSDSLANRQRKLAGDIANLKTELGEQLIPAMQSAISLVYELGEALDEALGGKEAAFAGLGRLLKGLADQMRDTIGVVAQGVEPPEDALLFGANNMITRLLSEAAHTAAAAVGASGAAERLADLQRYNARMRGEGARTAADILRGPDIAADTLTEDMRRQIASWPEEVRAKFLAGLEAAGADGAAAVEAEARAALAEAGAGSDDAAKAIANLSEELLRLKQEAELGPELAGLHAGLRKLKEAGASTAQLEEFARTLGEVDRLKAAAESLRELTSAADALRDSTRTEAERRAAEVARIEEMARAGLIDADTRSRGLAGVAGVTDARAQLEADIEARRARLDDPAGRAGAIFGDVQSALRQMQQDVLSADTDRKALEVAEKQLTKLEEIATALAEGRMSPEAAAWATQRLVRRR